MVIRYTFFIILLCLSSQSYSQLVPEYCIWNGTTYGAPQVLTTSHVSSDYGMRVVNGTMFHKGIDYDGVAEGDGVVSLTDGKITFIGRQPNSNVYYIAIDGRDINDDTALERPDAPIFAYLHIFRNSAFPIESGGFVLVNVQNVGFVIINRLTGIAYHRNDGIQVNFENTVYITQNLVAAGQVIAPIGRSGATNVHLHLSQLESGVTHTSPTESIDPWNTVNHEDNALTMQIRRRDLTPGLQPPLADNQCGHTHPHRPWGTLDPLNYATEQGRNVFECEIEMPNAMVVPGVVPGDIDPIDHYQNVVMNESRISWLIRNNQLSGSNYAPLIGLKYEGKYTIDPVQERTIYPQRMLDNYGGTGLGQNGCLPFAYRSNGDGGFSMNPQHGNGNMNGHPHDYYQFTDFYPRLHRSHTPGVNATVGAGTLAQYPWDARYFDGSYTMKGEVENTDGDFYYSPESSFLIDNFPPFVKSVKVYFSTGTCQQGGIVTQNPAYSRNWDPTDNGNIKLGVAEYRAVYGDNPGSLRIYAVTTEKMSDVLKLRIPALSQSVFSGTSQGIHAQSGVETWLFDLGEQPSLQNGQCYDLEFIGKDLAGNKLLKFDLPCASNDQPIIKVPTRNGANSWADPYQEGNDLAHGFKYYRCANRPGPDEPDECPPCISRENIMVSTTYASSSTAADGRLDLSIIGSLPTALITWTNQAGEVLSNEEDLEGLGVGIYCLTVEVGCCSVANCYEISACSSPLTGISLSFVETHPTVEDPDGGHISVSVVNGNGPYVYEWSNGVSASNIRNVVAGQYCVKVRDNTGCAIEACRTLVLCKPIDITGTIVSPSMQTCKDGSIDLSVSGGSSGTYTFQWAGSNISSTNEDITGLGVGPYTVTVTDAICGSAIENFQVIFRSNIFAISSKKNIGTCGQNGNHGLGAISLDVPSTGQYTYSWSGPESYSASTQNISNLSEPGEYSVTIKNSQGCTTVLTEVICCCSVDEPSHAGEPAWNPPICPGSNSGAADLEITGGVTQATNPEGKNGSINISVQGSYNVLYYWTGPGDFTSNSEDLFNINIGTYCVTVSDGCGGSATKCFTLEKCDYTRGNEYFLLDFVFIPACDKAPDGAIDLTVSNTPAPLQFVWTDAFGNILDNREDLKRVVPGYYTVKVTDANGCVKSKMVQLPSQNAKIKLEKLQPSCNGADNGIIEISMQPSDRVYDIYWSNNHVETGNTSKMSDLAPGEYCVTVTDREFNCESVACWTITDGIPESAVSVSALNLSCRYTSTGIDDEPCGSSIFLAIDGSYSSAASSSISYIFDWTGPGGTVRTYEPFLHRLCEGDYVVKITDIYGCTLDYKFSICCCKDYEPNSASTATNCGGDAGFAYWTIGPRVTAPSPANNFLGSIELLVDLGSFITVIWTKVGDPVFRAYTSKIENLEPGIYCYKLIRSCSQTTYEDCISIQPFINVSNIKHSCVGGHNGAVSFILDPSLTMPAVLHWPDGSELNIPDHEHTLTGLSAGSYTTTITDANGLSINLTFTIESSGEAEAYDIPLAQNGHFIDFLTADNACFSRPYYFFGINYGNNNGAVEFDVHSSILEQIDQPASFTIQWPNNSTSQINFDGNGHYSVLGDDRFGVDHEDPITIRLIDNATGCTTSECFKFGRPNDYVVRANWNYVLLPNEVGTYAYTGCVGCDKPSCGVCPPDHPGCEQLSPPEDFRYTPNDDNFPCSAGKLYMPCVDGNVSIELFGGIEFIDYDNPVNCKYKYQCLFPDPPSLDVFSAGYPIYVEGFVDIPGCIPPEGGGGPIGCGDCAANDLVYEVLFLPTCFGSITCTTSGVTCFRELTDKMRSCKRRFGEDDEQCLTIQYCDGDIMNQVVIESPCNVLDDIPYCDIARPASERSDIERDTPLIKLTSKLGVYPNPFAESLFVTFLSDIEGNSVVELFDLLGRPVFRTDAKLVKGANLYELSIDNIPNGVYIIQLTEPNMRISRSKVIKSN
jgi:Secretion system C-terminal sorting domain/SprB repeat